MDFLRSRFTIDEKKLPNGPKRWIWVRSQSRNGLPLSSRYFALAMRFNSEIFTPDEHTMSQRWQPMQRSIHSSTEGSFGLRNRSAPGPACFGPGKRGVTRDTGQMAIQVAQRIQTSAFFRGQSSLFIIRIVNLHNSGLKLKMHSAESIVHSV